MTDRESEVPLDLQHALDNVEDGGRGLLFDIHPPEEWHDCPECGERLHAQSVIHDGPDDILAVKYSCKCLALWVWEAETDELHYRGEAEVVDPFADRDPDE